MIVSGKISRPMSIGKYRDLMDTMDMPGTDFILPFPASYKPIRFGKIH
jgi:hypothetical protein